MRCLRWAKVDVGADCGNLLLNEDVRSKLWANVCSVMGVEEDTGELPVPLAHNVEENKNYKFVCGGGYMYGGDIPHAETVILYMTKIHNFRMCFMIRSHIDIVLLSVSMPNYLFGDGGSVFEARMYLDYATDTFTMMLQDVYMCKGSNTREYPFNIRCVMLYSIAVQCPEEGTKAFKIISTTYKHTVPPMYLPQEDEYPRYRLVNISSVPVGLEHNGEFFMSTDKYEPSS